MEHMMTTVKYAKLSEAMAAALERFEDVDGSESVDEWRIGAVIWREWFDAMSEGRGSVYEVLNDRGTSLGKFVICDGSTYEDGYYLSFTDDWDDEEKYPSVAAPGE